ncbi:hypothetical protein MRI28_10315 [Nocardiopsis dassonvillei]|uniref:hypothetical protein n=1 Tax=Nocardiopsis dassonvillei TaxID=2014 RepID=UPI00200EC540|nr:hypothetical protein [Nocardiopsis dassonvillei]MCK9870034.1 hypothetical protein [Nocardiopsis dassonvillei]
MDESPLASSRDRFPTGLPGRRVPISDEQPTSSRPWGMSRAVFPRPVMLGNHEKPTENRMVTRPTQFQNDGKIETDAVTETHTD